VRADAEGESAGTKEDREALALGKSADAEMDAAHARRTPVWFEHASICECWARPVRGARDSSRVGLEK
jgi:hypothetical protein